MMSAALVRGRPDGPALRAIGVLSARFIAPRASLTTQPPQLRWLNTSRRALPRRALGPAPNAQLRHVRFQSDTAAEKAAAAPQKSAIVRALQKTVSWCGVMVIGTGLAITAFFIFDATTYHETPTAADIPISELALNPRHGGPKNLPIADFLVSDYDSEEMLEQKDKPRLVILGTGWASIALLKNLNPGDYHVTVVSPTNYFLFTPMLPSATVGTLGLRSLVEPVRRIIDRVRGHFLKASATDVHFSEKLVEVSQVDNDGNQKSFYLPYDKLVIGVGKFFPYPGLP